jgi:hypothetical protein
MMTLQRFLIVGLVIFLLGLAALYTGINRAPFRQGEPGHNQKHGSSSLQFNEPART